MCIRDSLCSYGRRSHRIITRDHDRLDAHGAQVGEIFSNALFDDILEMHDAQNTMIASNDQRGSARARNPLDDTGALVAVHTATRLHIVFDGVGRPLPNLMAFEIDTAHALSLIHI